MKMSAVGKLIIKSFLNKPSYAMDIQNQIDAIAAATSGQAYLGTYQKVSPKWDATIRQFKDSGILTDDRTPVLIRYKIS